MYAIAAKQNERAERSNASSGKYQRERAPDWREELLGRSRSSGADHERRIDELRSAASSAAGRGAHCELRVRVADPREVARARLGAELVEHRVGAVVVAERCHPSPGGRERAEDDGLASGTPAGTR